MKWLPANLLRSHVAGSLLILMTVEFVRGALILSLLPTIGVTELGLTPAAVGLAISAHYFFDNILRSPMGAIADHIGSKYLLAGSLIIAAVGLLVVAQADGGLDLAAGAALIGVGTSPLWPSVISTVTASAGEKDKASAMGYVYIAWLIGGGAGPVIINFVLAASFRDAFLVLIILLLAAGVTAILLHYPKIEPVSHATQATLWSHPLRYLHELMEQVKEVRILFPGMFVQTFAIGVMIPVLTPYARVVLHISPQWQSLGLVIVGGVTVLLLPLMGKWVDHVGARPFLSGGFLLTSGTLVLFTLQHRFWPAIGALSLTGLAYAMVLPSWNSVLDRSIDSTRRGAMWGVFMTVEGLGTAAGPVVGGRLWDAVSPQAPFWLSAGVVGFMGLLYIFLRIPGLRSRQAVT
ncbi:MAG: MFS transporter [Firmicutes bacterium]|nr:MFS transporter [Bacillota bacterium]